ncbi:MAG: CBS domain-containing protein [Candidatus Neomarinimicrobiota bacterium]|nr:CBS domain-containing protein [Candidatus Neomarinimicrobiota bacterium]
MSDLIDEEAQQMDQMEFEEGKEMEEAISVGDSINTLTLQKMIVMPRGTAIQTVIEQFQAEGVACVLIGDDSLEGIFTERDVIMKLAGKGLDYHNEIVDDYMTTSPESLLGEDSIAFALNRMTEGGYRHIPVVDLNGKPVGLIGVLDIVRHLAEYFSQDVLNLPPSPLRKQIRAEGG